MSNYKVLFILRILKNLLFIFVDSFFVLYFLDISDSNIIPLGIYKLIGVITIYIIIFLTRNLAKSKYRVNLMRIGIILDFIYFLTIVLLKEKIIDYIYLVGLLYGLEEGFYYSVYNMFEAEGVTNEERVKFKGTYTAAQSILSIIFPLIFGSLIYTTGFLKSIIIVLIIVGIRIILSFMYKDESVPKSNKTNVKKYIEITKKDKKFRQMYKVEFFNGMIYSDGAFAYIVTVYIIKVFSNSFSLGIFTSIFSIVACIIGILFAKCIKKEHYTRMIKISMILTVISLCFMILKCNAITIIFFNLFKTISQNIMSLVNEKNQADICNDLKIKEEYKVEYCLVNETYLVIARIISNILFILMAYINPILIITIFTIFLILFAKNSIELQKIVEEDNNK